ncbi:MAG: zinc-binding dehydrogenase [Planctomycetota bacterium]|jgi:2-desacetyl-2-hydroxyethyl bacteriochlorophyllide A dehydrogenase
MEAAVIEKPGELVVRDVPYPKVGDYDCLCRMLFGATCTGTDQHMIAGRLPFTINYPTIMGHESVGRVVERGSKVRTFSEGDVITRVGHPGAPEAGIHSSWGGFAEFGIARDHVAMREDGLPESEWGRHRVNQVVPPEIDPRAATMIITWRETLSYITRAGVGGGSRVLVIGSGGNGLAFASHARNLGAESVVLIGSAAREPQGRSAGATLYFDYKHEGLAKRIAEAHPEPFDFIVDAIGKTGQVDRVLGLLADGGAVCVYGIDDHATYGLSPFKARGGFRVVAMTYDEEEVHEDVVQFIIEGKLDASIWLPLDNPRPLADIAKAMEDVRERRAVKALVRLNVDE